MVLIFSPPHKVTKGVGVGPLVFTFSETKVARVFSFTLRVLGGAFFGQALFLPSPTAVKPPAVLSSVSEESGAAAEDRPKKGAAAQTASTKKRSSSFTAETSTASDVKVPGVLRITRHPLFTSFALLGLSNLFTRQHVSGTRLIIRGSPDSTCIARVMLTN